MKRLLLILALALVALPAWAQSGDCFLETGTSTTWLIERADATSARIQYTFYDGSDLLLNFNFPPGTDVVALADSRCAQADQSRLDQEWQISLIRVQNNPNAELVQPLFPEVCGSVPAVPNNPPLTSLEQCRLAQFHQWLIRFSWPQDAAGHRRDFWDVWDWVDSSGPSSPGFNTTEKQAWLGVTSAEWSNAVNQRMNNMAAYVTSFDQDAQWIGELEDFN